MTGDPRLDQIQCDSLAPTAFPDVDAVLRFLVPRLRGALGSSLVGIYRFGSLTAGDFDPRRSDVDVLVVTEGPVSTEQFAALQDVHRAVSAFASPWAREVEAYYLTRAALRRDESSFGEHLKVNRGDGWLEPLQRDPGWLIQGHLLREFGVPLIGPPPTALVEPVAPGDLRCAAAAGSVAWLDDVLARPTGLRRRGYGTYLILTACRILYTLTNDAVVSKPVAGRWARGTLPERWHPLIDRALAWRKDEPPPDPSAADEEVDGTLELIRWVAQRCRAVGC
jgi:hypothetical protein